MTMIGSSLSLASRLNLLFVLPSISTSTPLGRVNWLKLWHCVAISILPAVGCTIVIILTNADVIVVVVAIVTGYGSICDVYISVVNNGLIRMASILSHINHLLLLLVVIYDSCIVANLIIVARTERASICRAVPLQLTVNLDLPVARLIYVARARLLTHETDNVCVDHTLRIWVELLLHCLLRLSLRGILIISAPRFVSRRRLIKHHCCRSRRSGCRRIFCNCASMVTIYCHIGLQVQCVYLVLIITCSGYRGTYTSVFLCRFWVHARSPLLRHDLFNLLLHYLQTPCSFLFRVHNICINNFTIHLVALSIQNIVLLSRRWLFLLKMLPFGRRRFC